jgi:hypothetical protein
MNKLRILLPFFAIHLNVTALMIIIIFSLLLLFAFGYYYDNNNNNNHAVAIPETAITTTTPSPDLVKVLIDNAIEALQTGNINETIMHIKAADQELAIIRNYSYSYPYYHPSIEALSKLLESDTVQALQKGDTNTALVYLNLADQKLGILLANIPNAYITIPRNTFLSYTNPRYGIKIQYPYNWIIEGTSYPAGKGGVQIAAFYLSLNVSEDLPFIRVGLDNLTKEFPRRLGGEVSTFDYLKKALEGKNSTGFPGFRLIESNVTTTNTSNSTLAGNHLTYSIIWTYTHPVYGIRKSIEIGTVIGNKGYFIDYTAAEPKFANHLPIIQKMINSFMIIRESTTTAISSASHHT